MRKACILFGLFLVGGCSYQGDIDKPYTQKATWYSYMNGDDIRGRCQRGVFEYRFVYNAVYREQLRAYEVSGGLGGEAVMVSRAQEGAGLRADKISVTDPLAQFGWTRAEKSLAPKEVRVLDDLLEKSRAGVPHTKGNRLRSDDFYWTAALCHDGNFVFNGWDYKDDDFARLHFVPFLLAQDNTGVEVNPPRDVGTKHQARINQSKRQKKSHSELEVGDNRLLVAGPWF